MAETIRATWEGLLELISTVIIPDWGALIGLIPVGLLLVILLWIGRLGWTWLGFYLAQPELPARRLDRNRRAEMVRGGMLIPAGGAIILVALTILPSRPNRVAEVGLDTVVLLAGIILALAGAALAITAAEAADAEGEPGGSRSPRTVLRGIAARFAAIPPAYRPLPGLAAGGLIILAAFVAAGASPRPGTLPEASIGLILLGILVGLGSATAAIRATEETDDAGTGAATTGAGTGSRDLVDTGGTEDRPITGHPPARSPGAYA